MKYTETGLITVRLESKDPASHGTGLEQIRLTVQDTGIGMTKQFLSKELYTPFKQADSHASGTGLGLSNVRRICRDSGAELDITSEIGVGTCATVDLYARFVTEPAASPPHSLSVGRFHWFTPNESAQLTPRSIAPSVIQTARDWLKCGTTQGPVCEDKSGSVVYAVAEEDLLTWTNQETTQFFNAGKRPSHVLVLGQSLLSVSFETPPTDLPFTPIFIHQPYVCVLSYPSCFGSTSLTDNHRRIGPRKLLRAIAADQSSTEMGLARPRPEIPSPLEYEVTRPSDLGRPPEGYLPSNAMIKQRASGPGPSTDDSATSSAVFSAAHPSVFNSAPTESSSSIDSTVWHEYTGKDPPRDTVLLVEDNEGWYPFSGRGWWSLALTQCTQ